MLGCLGFSGLRDRIRSAKPAGPSSVEVEAARRAAEWDAEIEFRRSRMALSNEELLRITLQDAGLPVNRGDVLGRPYEVRTLVDAGTGMFSTGKEVLGIRIEHGADLFLRLSQSLGDLSGDEIMFQVYPKKRGWKIRNGLTHPNEFWPAEFSLL